ncbi:hypothetical protein PspLS_09690 [Pyricularia sp. CBS 133598]|nr:hypothetical protein PspLS_09690 [Pyricularia sp. CBS 133598]
MAPAPGNPTEHMKATVEQRDGRDRSLRDSSAVINVPPDKTAQLGPVATAKLTTESAKDGGGVEDPPPRDEYDVDAADNGLGDIGNVAWKEVKSLGSAGYGNVHLQECYRRNNGGDPDRRHILQRCLRVVKKLPKPRGQEALDATHFASELAATTVLSLLQYEYHFVKSMGWYEDPNHLYVTMEYLHLGDLESQLLSGTKISDSYGKALGRQILVALRYVHSAGFAHRDIKLSNILIKEIPPNDSWWIKLGGFGISKAFRQQNSMSNTAFSSLDFMAPELLMLSSAQPGQAALSQLEKAQRADIWAVGETLFQMLTRTSSFAGNMRRLIGYVDRHVEFPRAELLHNNVSSGGEAFIKVLDDAEPDTAAYTTLFSVSSGQAIIQNVKKIYEGMEIRNVAFIDPTHFILAIFEPKKSDYTIWGFQVRPGMTHRDTTYWKLFKKEFLKRMVTVVVLLPPPYPWLYTKELFLATSWQHNLFAMANGKYIVLTVLREESMDGPSAERHYIDVPTDVTIKKLCLSTSGRMRERIPCPPGTGEMAICRVRKTFAVTTRDDQGTFISIWDAKAPCWVRWYQVVAGLSITVRSLSFSADGKYLAVLRDDGGLVVCHVERGDGRGQVCYDTGEKSLGEVAFPMEGSSEVLTVSSVCKGGRTTVFRLGTSGD